MKKTFKCWSDDLVRIIYPTFIRPHLEFASSVWNPNRKRDIDTLEKVQRRATKTIESRHLSYEKRIKKLGLTTLEQRRHRGDFIQCFKIIHGLDKVNWCTENKIQGNCKKDLNSRRHNLQLTRELVQNCESRHFFLMNRIATPWNNLPVKIVNAKSVNCFKNALDKHLEHINWKTHTYSERFC